MSVDRNFVTENQAERLRLQHLVHQLSDKELAAPMPAGWTVAGVLGHLAFWDQRILALLARWEEQGGGMLPEGMREIDVDWINDSTKPLLLALDPRAAADLALAIAEAVDAKLESLSDQFLERNAAAGTPINLWRAHHRRQHLDEIEQARRR